MRETPAGRMGSLCAVCLSMSPKPRSCQGFCAPRRSGREHTDGSLGKRESGTLRQTALKLVTRFRYLGEGNPIR